MGFGDFNVIRRVLTTFLECKALKPTDFAKFELDDHSYEPKYCW